MGGLFDFLVRDERWPGPDGEYDDNNGEVTAMEQLQAVLTRLNMARGCNVQPRQDPGRDRADQG